MRLILIYLTGLIFGFGISLSGMANPAKVINFFDVAGAWDPSLSLVMFGALIVTFVGYKLIFGRKAPIFDTEFHVPTARNINFKLIGGSAVFGVGWGISGFCPGAALPALGTGSSDVFWFVGAMIAGIFAAKLAMQMQHIRNRFFATDVATAN